MNKLLSGGKKGDVIKNSALLRQDGQGPPFNVITAP